MGSREPREPCDVAERRLWDHRPKPRLAPPRPVSPRGRVRAPCLPDGEDAGSGGAGRTQTVPRYREARLSPCTESRVKLSIWGILNHRLPSMGRAVGASQIGSRASGIRGQGTSDNASVSRGLQGLDPLGRPLVPTVLPPHPLLSLPLAVPPWLCVGLLQGLRERSAQTRPLSDPFHSAGRAPGCSPLFSRPPRTHLPLHPTSRGCQPALGTKFREHLQAVFRERTGGGGRTLRRACAPACRLRRCARAPDTHGTPGFHAARGRPGSVLPQRPSVGRASWARRRKGRV